MKVKDKLQEFYTRNNLGSDGGVNDNWNTFRFGQYLSVQFPNLNKDGYLLHDVNHLLCGYGIDWKGEFETAAWEMASGGRKGFGLSWFYPIVGTLLGLFVAPQRTVRAYRLGATRKNAHILSKSYDLLDMDFEKLNDLSQKS